MPVQVRNCSDPGGHKTQRSVLAASLADGWWYMPITLSSMGGALQSHATLCSLYSMRHHGSIVLQATCPFEDCVKCQTPACV